MHKFRELQVYQKGMMFDHHIRAVTKTFPKEELFVLSSQTRRAADSIILNIAKGAGNNSKQEFRKFLVYAIRSGYECIACLDIALREMFIDEDTFKKLFNELDQIIAMLNGFHKSLLR